MADRPLLVFPIREIASRTKLSSGNKDYHYPRYDRQGNRLSGIFNELQTAFNERSVEIQQSASGIDPEQVLVLETVGSVEDFINAVKLIDGFEWMSEIDVDEITPDEDFYSDRDPLKTLNGRLYLIMSNQRALNEMLSLWRSYIENPRMKFQRGLGRFKSVFLGLKDIRRWSVQDRLEDTGIIQYWKESVDISPDELISFETELWFRNSALKRNENQQYINTVITELGGQITSSCQLEGIKYHALLTKLPARVIVEIIESPDNELVKNDGVMFFRPVGQIISEYEEENQYVEEYHEIEEPSPSDDPVLALFDGLPIANHYLIKNHLIIDDPDDWAESYRVEERVHGTAMASLIIGGDLNNGYLPINTKIYVRPVLRPLQDDIVKPNREFVPDDILVVDLIHRAVARLFEGSEPIAPTVKIINLSIGDPSRHFNMTMSPLSRLLDWLSEKYNVLFIVSAGNHPISISLNISKSEFEALNNTDREELIIKSLISDLRNRKLLSPAESLNALTIGALHDDNSSIGELRDRINPLESLLPSPITAFGSGYRRSVKPDLVLQGGRQLYRAKVNGNDPTELSPVVSRIPPGNQVAVPDSKGSLSMTKYTCGTSNATALVSHASILCYQSLMDVLESQLPEVDFGNYIPVILKAMLVHGANWGDVGDRLSAILSSEEDNARLKNLISNWIGNGVPDFEKVFDCTQWRATAIGFGELNDGDAHIYKLPLPPGFSSIRGFRRITVTLAWFSPISVNSQKYRTASLWFEVNKDILNCDRTERDWQAVRRGTLQHEVFEGESASPYSSSDTLDIKVNCRKDANGFEQAIRYGLFVSFEVSDELEVNIYEEIRTKLASTVQIEQKI